MKIYIYILLFCLLISLLILFYNNEKFDNNEEYPKKIISELVRPRAGFYSLLFVLLNQYLYCKKNKIDFEIDSSNWLYKSENGWIDYFKDIKLNYNIANRNKIVNKINEPIDEFKLIDYKDAIKELYIYNDKISTNINKLYKIFNLQKQNYNAIFIRWGDKLSSESVKIPINKYIDLVLLKDPECKVIYLQTDDYSCYEECIKYIEDNNLNIKMITNCDPNTKGVVVDYLQLNADKSDQQSYVDKLKNVKPLINYNSSEMYDHVYEVISGIDIVLNSKYCVTDYQSNVSRFIKLAHIKSSNVFDVENPNNEIDYTKVVCPALSF